MLMSEWMAQFTQLQTALNGLVLAAPGITFPPPVVPPPVVPPPTTAPPLPVISNISWKVWAATPPTTWTSLTFDDRAWPVAVDQGAHGSPPWNVVSGFPTSGGARWVWDKDSTNQALTSPVEHRYFRKKFSNSGPVAKAALTVCCDNSCWIYLDGQQIGVGTDWQKPVVVMLDFGAPADHVLCIRADNSGGPGGLLVDLRIGGAPPAMATKPTPKPSSSIPRPPLSAGKVEPRPAMPGPPKGRSLAPASGHEAKELDSRPAVSADPNLKTLYHKDLEDLSSKPQSRK